MYVAFAFWSKFNRIEYLLLLRFCPEHNTYRICRYIHINKSNVIDPSVFEWRMGCLRSASSYEITAQHFKSIYLHLKKGLICLADVAAPQGCSCVESKPRSMCLWSTQAWGYQIQHFMSLISVSQELIIIMSFWAPFYHMIIKPQFLVLADLSKLSWSFYVSVTSIAHEWKVSGDMWNSKPCSPLGSKPGKCLNFVYWR